MPNTTHGLPYPASTYPPNVPADLAALANALDAYLPIVVEKTAVQDVVNSATLVNDTHLFVPLGVGRYAIRGVLRAIGAQAGDIKTAWTYSGSTTRANRNCLGPALATTNPGDTTGKFATAGLGTAVPYGTDSVSSGSIIEELYLITTTAGTLRLTWAQNTANATATTLNTECRLYAQKMAV